MATPIGSRALVFYLDSTDFTDHVKDVRIKVSETDSDFVSFSDAAAGGAKDYSLVITMKQDTATDSLWYYAWNEAGVDNTYEIWPNGYNGGVPTATYPKFSGSVTIELPDGDLLGGEANKSNTMRFTTEVEWKCTAKPTLTVA